MTKEEKVETKLSGLTINDGIRFGFGFALVNLATFATIGVVSWLIIVVTRYFGLVF